MDRWRGKIAVVTGASAGIGASICKTLVEEGLQVVGFARRVERVQELADSLKGKAGKLYPIKCDVTNQEEITKSFKWIKENLGVVQILINNAGIYKISTLLEGNPNDWKTVMDTNVMGLCMCTREAFMQMKKAGLDGHIVHINSISGHSVISGEPAFLNMYSPSKHAVTCITEIMRREIYHNKANVKITSLSPGLVDTDINQAAGLNTANHDVPELITLSSEDISDAVIYLLSTPPHILIQELTIRPMGENLYS